MIILALLLLSSTANAQDIFLQTRLEERTLTALIDKTRVLLNNSNIGDQMAGEIAFKDDINFPLDEITTDVDYPKFRDLISTVFKIDLKNAVIRVRIPKIGYKVEKLSAAPLNLSVSDPLLDLGVTASIHGITTSLDAGLDLDLMIPNQVTKKNDSYLTAHVDPTTIIVPNTIEPMSFGIQLEAHRDQFFTYNLKSYDLSAVPDFVNNHLKDFEILNIEKNIPLSAQNIAINPVIVRLGDLSRTIDFDVFRPIVQKRLDKIITLVFAKIAESLQTKIGPNILKSVFAAKTASDLVIKNDSLYTRFVTANFSQPAPNQLYLGVNGELCTAESYKQNHEQCTQQEKFPDPVRLVSDGDRSNAKLEIMESLARGDSDLVLSLSEEYLNQLLSITIDANLWDSSLSAQHLALGPKGAFLVLNERTQTPELYLDVLYQGQGGAEGLIVNVNHPLRFPLRISTAMSIINVGGIPHLIIKTNKVLSENDDIINGIPEFDLPSHLIPGLRKKISKMVLKMSAQIEGQTAMDLDLPVLKNIDLEKTWHEASPFGRLNLFFKL